ncbi:hypothetical protein [uncultured Methylobacterium sp.]|jgi:hypothetical protein|uniref:hypothetical protein n=1 Tax=uncultured Methylobacterium sp. TaxID=157278 RepID=UPI0026139F1F|nr:hypothetical protein [uncultured Methylobacterium sp.]
MTLKITRRGKIPDRTLEGTCRTCTTVIECLPEDCEQSRDPREHSLSVSCPVCKSTIYPSSKPSSPTDGNELYGHRPWR